LILLDENILEGQRLLLEGWNVPVRPIGVDAGRKGLADEEVIVLLRRLRRPTLFTRDLGFYTPELRHDSYAIVIAVVGQYEMAAFVRRFLRHPAFNTQSRRMGKVVRLSPTGIAFWQIRRQQEAHLGWPMRP
jgi:hypothetical protein